jgi:hypothetical protein
VYPLFLDFLISLEVYLILVSLIWIVYLPINSFDKSTKNIFLVLCLMIQLFLPRLAFSTDLLILPLYSSGSDSTCCPFVLLIRQLSLHSA